MQTDRRAPGARPVAWTPVIRVFAIIFIAALFAKGGALFHGYSTDDYSFIIGNGPDDLGTYFSQGRYLSASIAWAMDAIGVNLSDMYFSFGMAALLVQSALVVAIFRFVGLENSPSAGLIGAIAVAHPYLAEMLTFRMSLPGYCVAVALTITALEMVRRDPAGWRSRLAALFATVAMLLIYQVFLNYLAVAIIFAVLSGALATGTDERGFEDRRLLYGRAMTLASIAVAAAALFAALVWIGTTLGAIVLAGRAKVISLQLAPDRLEQIFYTLIRIYSAPEPIFPEWLKVLVGLLGISSLLPVVQRMVARGSAGNRRHALLAVIAICLLVPASLGIIVALADWWPAPRVIAHVALMLGLAFLLGDACADGQYGAATRSTILAGRAVVLVSFVMLSNQILGDQQRVNQWDRMTANRIIARLEALPNFSDVRYVHVNGGSWGYPATLRVVEFDINISAFSQEWSKVRLLSEVSGYSFAKANETRAVEGRKYCEGKQPWPDIAAVVVLGELAVVCLGR